MKSIFLCFANDEKETLKSLKKERNELLKLLDRGNSKNHFTLKEIPNATIEKVSDGLIDYCESLNVFLFSGHASHDKLAFEDGIANPKGIVGLLKQCPNLDLVILNGCSTVGQVKALYSLPSKPAVIATSAPVEDYSATRFSIALFKTLVEQSTVLRNAFDTAMSAVQVSKEPLVIRSYRELISKDDNEGVWGLYINQKRKELEQWRLPKGDNTKQSTDKINNVSVKGEENITVTDSSGPVTINKISS